MKESNETVASGVLERAVSWVYPSSSSSSSSSSQSETNNSPLSPSPSFFSGDVDAEGTLSLGEDSSSLLQKKESIKSAAEELDGEDLSEKLKIDSISFACGGWLFIYMFGVAKAMQENQILTKRVKFAGCSAGGLVSAGLALEGDFEAAKKFCKERCVTRAYASISGIFKIGDYVSECLDYAVDLKKVVSLPKGKCQIQFTRLPFFRGERALEYESEEDIKKCLLSSAAAFPFAPLVYHRGYWNVDGGYTAFQPLIDKDSITVSPLYFVNADIKPSRYVPLWWSLFPPNSPNTVDWLYDLGYNDAINWIHERSEKLKMGKTVGLKRTRSNDFHPFDIPRQISVHRFLGFDVANLTHSSVSMLMDFCLYLLLLFVWKPIAITMIYMELFVKVVILAAATLLYEAYDLLPMIFVGWAFLPPQKTVQLWVYSFTGAAKLAVAGPAQGSHMGDLWDCIRCMFSFSLLKRYLPTSLSKLSADPLKKHVHLNKSSLVYRVVRHFV